MIESIQLKPPNVYNLTKQDIKNNFNIHLHSLNMLSIKYSLTFIRETSKQLPMWQISKHAKSHSLWRAFHVIAAESNQPEINPFHVVTHITVKWNAILTLGITVTCNQARVMLFKWHHFVRFQLVHTIGGFMMTGACVKPVSRGYENRVTSGNQSTAASSHQSTYMLLSRAD